MHELQADIDALHGKTINVMTQFTSTGNQQTAPTSLRPVCHRGDRRLHPGPRHPYLGLKFMRACRPASSSCRPRPSTITAGA